MFDALNLKPEVFGLDISDLSIKIAKLKKKGNSFELVSFAQEVVAPGVISDGEIKNSTLLAETIKRAVKNVKGKKINTKYVIASLPEEKSFLQIIQLPKMEESEIRGAVSFEAENYVPLPIESVYLDFQIIPLIPGCKTDHADVLIAALPKETVDPYVSCLKAAGLKPLAMEIESQAISRSLVQDEVSEFPILLIDFGALRTSFIIFAGRSLRFTTSIKVSSQILTEALSKNLKIKIEEAEKIKIKQGLGEKDSKIFQALIPCLTDLSEQIKKYLHYYDTHIFHDHLPLENKLVKKIIISGGGANLKGLPEFLSSELNLPVQVANPWVNINQGKTAKNKVVLPKETALSFTTALGLALRGIKNFND
jgi:type IV pilus assembly protein PilM